MTRILTDSWVAVHPTEAGNYHLIIVGTPQSNGTLREHPSLWWRTAEDQGTATFPVQGLYLFGVGDLRGRASGVVEPCRNPYAIASREAPPDPGEQMTWIVRCAGRFPEGAVAAVRALLDEGMLSGAVIDQGMTSGAVGSLEIDPGVLTAAPPGWALQSTVEGFTQVGWHQVDRLLCDALTNRVGQRPLGVWRLAYRGSAGPHNISANLHRRNTAGEVLLCKMKDSQAAASAIRRLLNGLGRVEERRQGTLTVLEVSSGGGTVCGAAVGSFWGVENIDAPGGRRVLVQVMSSASN